MLGLQVALDVVLVHQLVDQRVVHHAVIQRVVVGLDRPQPVAQHQVAVHQVVVDRVVETAIVAHVAHALHVWNAEVAHRGVGCLILADVLSEIEVGVGIGVGDWGWAEIEMSVLADQHILVDLFWLFEDSLFGGRFRQEWAKVVIVGVDVVGIDAPQVVGKCLV